MLFSADYSRDTEFRKLIARRKDVNMTLAAMELARDAYPTLEFEPVLKWITDRAAELTGPMAHAGSELESLKALSSCLAGVHGLKGDRQSFDLADSSYLHKVIDNRRGIPISLGVLYISVAEQAGLRLRGVAAPGHFLTRYDSIEGPLFLDAFNSGVILSLDEALDRLQNQSGLETDAGIAALKAVGPRPIITRMLNNLKALHAKQQNWRAAWQVQSRLVALQPTSYNERRDLGLISLKAGRAGQALNLLESCLKTCPTDETTVIEQQLAEARREVSRWN